MHHHTQQQYRSKLAEVSTLSQRLHEGLSEVEYWRAMEQYNRAENDLLVWAMQELGITACPHAQRSSIVVLVSEWSSDY